MSKTPTQPLEIHVVVSEGRPVAAFDGENQALGEAWCIKKRRCLFAEVVTLNLNESAYAE